MPKLIEIFDYMISDERDHWLGLVDRESGYLFWYNLRDDSSQWMSEEDQIAYKAGFRLNPENLVIGPGDVPPKSNTKRLNPISSYGFTASTAAEIEEKYKASTGVL